MTSVGRGALERLPRLQALAKSDRIQGLIQTWRGARVVDERARFVALQCGRPRTAIYGLRGPSMKVILRHGARDVALLNEIFGTSGGPQSCYEPPAEVQRMLGSEPSPRILDLGANIGLFGIFALHHWPRSRLVAFEPDPENRALLEQAIAENGFGDRWTVVPAAVSCSEGEMSFVAGAFSESRIASGAEQGTIAVHTVDLFETDTAVDLLKMDIEGGEWAILGDPRLPTLAARAIVLEWHARNAPEPDARAAAARLLRAAGYRNTQTSPHDGTDTGVLWAWR